MENIKYDVTNNLAMQCNVMADKLVKANYILDHACIGKRTKAEMKKAIEEADSLIFEVRTYLIGR